MAKTVFDHVNAIYQDQSIDYFDNLSESDKKTFNVYMIQRIISMNPDQLELVNEFQTIASNAPPRAVYLFFSKLLPKKRQFNKYIKSSKSADQNLADLKLLIAKHYEISSQEAEEYIEIVLMQENGKDQLVSFATQHGIEEDTIKNWGL